MHRRPDICGALVAANDAKVGSPSLTAEIRTHLAEVLLGEGDSGSAALAAQRSLAISARAGFKPQEADARLVLGRIDAARDRLIPAAQAFRRVLEFRDATGDRGGRADALVALADVERRAGVTPRPGARRPKRRRWPRRWSWSTSQLAGPDGHRPDRRRPRRPTDARAGLRTGDRRRSRICARRTAATKRRERTVFRRSPGSLPRARSNSRSRRTTPPTLRLRRAVPRAARCST